MNATDPKSADYTVKQFYREHGERIQLHLLTQEGCGERVIKEGDIHRPGLALAGFVDLFSYARIQICGNTEATYLAKLAPEALESTLDKVLAFEIPCILFTDGNRPPETLIRKAEARRICVFNTPLPTTAATQLVSTALQDRFSPKAHIHGTLVDVYGVGILITGKSAIGKTEVALDLVKRGHRLVADDVVTVSHRAGGLLIGQGNDVLKHCMEIRGVGILDIQAAFGIRGIRYQKRVEVMVELKEWERDEKYERLGLDEKKVAILGESIPMVQLSVFPGKTIAVIVEVIALNHLLKFYGYNPAKVLEERLNKKMGIDPDRPCFVLDPDSE